MNKDLGVLVHVCSLKSEYGIGDFGKSSIEFIDFLKNKNIKIWQILPLSETNEYNCPYSSMCYFAYDPMYVDVEDLVERKLISILELKTLKKLPYKSKIDYDVVKKEKLRLFELAYNNLDKHTFKELEKAGKKDNELKKYAIYKALVEMYGENWRDFPFDINDETRKEYKDFVKNNKKIIYKYVFFQYILDSEWQKVLNYAKENGIRILGDLPVYPNKNSFDVYSQYDQYLLDKNRNPLVYGGVPADDFCKAGQNWGTCVYDWKKMAKNGYILLINKIQKLLNRYNLLRIDHFIGYVAHWEVSAKNNDPLLGKWVKSGGESFFKQLFKVVDKNNIVVEDLGVDREDVTNVRNEFDLSGMCVLQMVLETDKNVRYLPNNVGYNCLYYLGTHDNNTFVGYLNSLSTEDRKKFLNLMGLKGSNNKKLCIACIKKMLESNSKMVILQMQDYLLQDSNHRMNYPGRAENCWDYRVPKNYQKQFTKNLAKILK